jgi:hypothetical protein
VARTLHVAAGRKATLQVARAASARLVLIDRARNTTSRTLDLR